MLERQTTPYLGDGNSHPGLREGLFEATAREIDLCIRALVEEAYFNAREACWSSAAPTWTPAPACCWSTRP